VVALTYRVTVDQPPRPVHFRAVGAHVGLMSKRYQSGETDYHGGISKCGCRPVAVARRLVVVLHRMWVDGSEFHRLRRTHENLPARR
jgi:transposase